MRKFALKLDELAVESFDTSHRGSERGTILANSGSDGCSFYTGECCTPAGTHGGNTCETTCHQLACGCTNRGGTCDYSCGFEGCDFTEYAAACPSQPGYQGCSD
jgi:hypothetical protein